ncbi:hypothetical protein IMCC21224_113865 [Puniceibacterium sp. IMCC21224]|nr:hypothetical protein IMCC21224_113865 [Puniceibacterium sp. IMCC21224]
MTMARLRANECNLPSVGVIWPDCASGGMPYSIARNAAPLMSVISRSPRHFTVNGTEKEAK